MECLTQSLTQNKQNYGDNKMLVVAKVGGG